SGTPGPATTPPSLSTPAMSPTGKNITSTGGESVLMSLTIRPMPSGLMLTLMLVCFVNAAANSGRPALRTTPGEIILISRVCAAAGRDRRATANPAAPDVRAKPARNAAHLRMRPAPIVDFPPARRLDDATILIVAQAYYGAFQRANSKATWLDAENGFKVKGPSNGAAGFANSASTIATWRFSLLQTE